MPRGSAHLARVGAWTVALAALIELVYTGLTTWVRVQTFQRFQDEAGREPWLAALGALGDGYIAVQVLLTSLLLVGLLQLRRGVDERRARALLLVAAIAACERVVAAAAMLRFGGSRKDEVVLASLTWGELSTILQNVGTFCELAMLGLLLVALALVRRARGQALGLAWALAAGSYALGSAVVLLLHFEVLRADLRDPSMYGTRQAWLAALRVIEVGTLCAALVSFARATLPNAIAARWRAAAQALSTYRRALLAKLALLLGSAGVALALGVLRTSPRTSLKVLSVGVGLGVLAGVGQIVGLVRYNDAPAPIARPALGVALVGATLAALVECLALGVLVNVAWSDPESLRWRPLPPDPRALETVAQLASLLGISGLLVSLRRAALGLEATALAEKIIGLGAATLMLGLVAYIVRGLGPGQDPGWMFAAVVLLGAAVAVFVGVVQALSGLASAMADRGHLSPGPGGLTAAPAARDDAAHDRC